MIRIAIYRYIATIEEACVATGDEKEGRKDVDIRVDVYLTETGIRRIAHFGKPILPGTRGKWESYEELNGLRDWATSDEGYRIREELRKILERNDTEILTLELLKLSVLNEGK